MPNSEASRPKYLGKQSGQFPEDWQGLDVFDTPEGVHETVYSSDEFSALCPVTGNPDWYKIAIIIEDSPRLIESKSLKLYLNRFRNVGVYAEALGAQIASDIQLVTSAASVETVIDQKPRGGVRITSKARSFQLKSPNPPMSRPDMAAEGTGIAQSSGSGSASVNVGADSGADE